MTPASLYFYDEFNDPRVVEQYKWVNDEWVYVGEKSLLLFVYPGRKVTLCHNGHSISVAPQAVRAHLAHGDSLGPCMDEGRTGGGQTDKVVNEEVKYAKVFPNPASGQFELVASHRSPFHDRTADLRGRKGCEIRGCQLPGEGGLRGQPAQERAVYTEASGRIFT